MSKDSGYWNQVERLFHELIHLSNREQIKCLEALSKEKPSVASEVRSLLDAGKAVKDKSDDPINALIDDHSHHPLPPGFPKSGDEVGKYTIIEEIGRGGMGVVYKGERTDKSIERPVAIKILATLSHLDDVHSRFLQEEKLLSKLNHSNIAQLFDVGVTSNGQPFYVMEYIDGPALCNTVTIKD